jgi:hypothetical protein
VSFGYSHAQPAHSWPPPALAQRSAPQISFLKALSHRVGGVGELVAKGAIGDADANIDGGTGKRRLVAALELQIIQKRRFGQVTFDDVTGVMKTFSPANKVQQVLSAGAQRGVR